MRSRNRTVATKICEFSASAGGGKRGRKQRDVCTKPRSTSSVSLPLCTAPRTDRKAIGKAVTLAFQLPQLLVISKERQRCAISLNVKTNEMATTSEEKQGLELRPAHRGHLSNSISSLPPYFIKSCINKHPLKQTH